MRLTKKQEEILNLVNQGNRDEQGEFMSWLDMDQLHTRLSYEASKQAIQCSIRVLEGRELLTRSEQELRRGRLRRVIMPTGLGIDVMKGR